MNFLCILSAGQGKRLNLNLNKGLVKIGKETLLEIVLNKATQFHSIDKIIVVTDKKGKLAIDQLLHKSKSKKVCKESVIGGKERQESAYNGLKYIDSLYPPKNSNIFFHNVANIFFTEDDINNLINELKYFKACALARKATSTIRETDDENISKGILSREKIYEMETPQCIRLDTALKAFDFIFKEKIQITDDVMACEKIGIKVKIVETSPDNIKITTAKDLQLAKIIFKNGK